MPSYLQATSPLAEWLHYLENSHFKVIDLGLERVKSVAQTMDLLHPAPFVITVGGTNGKGTTCRLLELVLLNAGYRVGVYSSPHLLRYNERVRIQNQELEDSVHTQSFAFIEQHKTQSLTYFEFSTLSALYLFKQANLDVVILEVGLGGRLDATNIVDSNIAVITGIDIDHTDFLGSTREQIAFEKAGIFRADCPVIIGDPDVPHTMIDYAEMLHCKVFRRYRDWQFEEHADGWQWWGTARNGQQVRLENLPFCRIPLANVATALAVIQQLPFDIAESVIRQSLQQVELTGRFQKMRPTELQPLATLLNRPIAKLPQFIIDVGHNPQAARYLREKLTTLKAQNKTKIMAICGVLKDKDAAGIFSPLLSVIDYWHCISLDGSRGQTGDELIVTLQQIARENSVGLLAESSNSIVDAIKSAVEKLNENDTLIIFGSFYTVGKFLQVLENK